MAMSSRLRRFIDRFTKQVLAERESESKDLRLNISELEANTEDLHAKFEAALAHLEQDTEDKDAEIQAANQAIEKLSEQIYVLEDENDRLKEEAQRSREDDAAEHDRLEILAAALKEVKLTFVISEAAGTDQTLFSIHRKLLL